jgi:hypothetical protein
MCVLHEFKMASMSSMKSPLPPDTSAGTGRGAGARDGTPLRLLADEVPVDGPRPAAEYGAVLLPLLLLLRE